MVEEGNQTRQGLSASMMERLKKASGEYEVKTPASLTRPALARCCPSWHLLRQDCGCLLCW